MVPEIVTRRLRLRGHCLEDFAASAAMWADPEVTRFITGGRPFTEQESWTRFLRYAGLWSMLNYGYWVVEEQATSAFVGEIGFADFKRNVEPSIRGIPELGTALVPRVYGKGYALEANRAVLDWARTNLPSPKIVCLITPENLASIRVAEKVGFSRYCETTDVNQAVIVFMKSN